MSQKIKITPVMSLEAEASVMNDRNASVALVHLWDSETGEVIGHATGASKREKFDTYNESVAVKLAVGRALQKMARTMISEANKEVRTAMAEAEAKAAEKATQAGREGVQSFADWLTALKDELGLSGGQPLTTLEEAEGAKDAAYAYGPYADAYAARDDELSAASYGASYDPFTGHDESVTADGTKVADLPESLRVTLASLGLYPHEVQIVDLDSLAADGI